MGKTKKGKEKESKSEIPDVIKESKKEKNRAYEEGDGRLTERKSQKKEG